MPEISGWGQATRSQGCFVTAPDESALSRLVTDPSPRGLLARGLGRSYGDAAQNAGGLLLTPFQPDSMPVVDPQARTVTATAGVSMQRLLQATLPLGLLPPVLPGTRHVTLGGALAADVHGKNHHVDGSLGSWVDRLRLVDGTGTVRVLTPTSDSAAFWATVGGMGLTGIVTQVVLRLLPVETAFVRVRTRRVPDLDALITRMRDTASSRYQVAWVDCHHGGRALLDDGEPAPLADLTGQNRRDPLAYRPAAAVPAIRSPVNLVRPAAVRGFNAGWWAAARGDAPRTVPLGRFFHPLDGLAHWNRLYGPAGLLQYQLVVPDGAEHILHRFTTHLPARGLTPALVVLKRFGPASAAPLSFPTPGWTLAADLPAGHPALPAALDALDEEVAAAGGRVYLAKDARLRPDLLAAMYPRLAEWRGVHARLDPHDRFRSDLARRLEMC